MTNYLAVATVTAALRNIIQTGIKEDLPGTTVTSVTPEGLNNAQKERKINIYLYQVSPIKELQQENSIPNRHRYNGKTNQKSLQLNLYYLITFYGNELELEPQQLLGSTIRTLLDQSILERDAIDDAISRSDFLANSTLVNQVNKLSFAMNSMTPEELTRIWSTLFRSPYSLSIAYVGKAVLIEGGKSGKTALPVRNVLMNASTKQLVIEEIKSSTGKNQPITTKSDLTIIGQNLSAPYTQVRIGNIKITPQKVDDKKVELNLSQMNKQELKKLNPGIQSVQIVHSERKASVIDPIRFIESNAMPLVLCPIVTEENIKIDNIRPSWNQSYSAEITIIIEELTVGEDQRVSLLMNEISDTNPEAYVFSAKPRKSENELLNFLVRDVKAGEYLIRVQINGAESPLEIDEVQDSFTVGQYYKPKLVIGLESKNTAQIANNHN